MFGYELLDDNPVGRAFMLIECFSGNVAMDLGGGYDAHRGNISDSRKPAFFRGVAAAHVRASRLCHNSILHLLTLHVSGPDCFVRLPQIGTVVREDDGSYSVGSIPWLGGPFDTAAAFFGAWAEHAEYPYDDDFVRQSCRSQGGEGVADQLLSAIKNFPTQIKSLAQTLSSSNDGPFPLIHPDSNQSNIVVDDEYNILGVIDWEAAHTVPWELVEVPHFLSTTPRPMDGPWNYDANGTTTDPELVRTWQDIASYTKLVAEAEGAAGTDCKLSSVLRDDNSQYLGHAIRRYTEGKMGFRDRVLEPFYSRHQPSKTEDEDKVPEDEN